MATITTEMQRHIIRELLSDGGNHRLAVFQQINRQFLDYALAFFDLARRSKVKWEETHEGDDEAAAWYKRFALEQASDRDDLQIVAGIPAKTVTNIYGGASQVTILNAAADNIQFLTDTLQELNALRKAGPAVRIAMGDGFEFTHSESLLIFNSLAVKRAQISGGNWSSVGMQVETPLLQTLCLLYGIDGRYHRKAMKKDSRYQVDYMLQRRGVEYRCEVKLNGRGNPESVTSAIARDPRILLADWISDQNREKLNASDIAWIDFSDQRGFRRFADVLDKFQIPHSEPQGLDRLDSILDQILPLP